MNTYSKIYTGLILAVISVGTVNAEQVHDAKVDLVEEATNSPRGFCRKTGGIVYETSQQTMYLCCYASKNKCVATDLNKSVSWLLPYGAQFINQSYAYRDFVSTL